jgi:hypothetical protein
MREGQFWGVLGFALAIAMTTWLDQSQSQFGALNAAFVGLVLVLASGLELAGLRHGMDVTQTALGLWLAVSPFALPYTSTAYVAVAHVILGLLLALLGAYRLLHRWRADLRGRH